MRVIQRWNKKRKEIFFCRIKTLLPLIACFSVGISLNAQSADANPKPSEELILTATSSVEAVTSIWEFKSERREPVQRSDRRSAKEWTVSHELESDDKRRFQAERNRTVEPGSVMESSAIQDKGAPGSTNSVFGCDSGYYILDSLGGRHRVGNPIRIVGSLFFGVDMARDMERAICEKSGTWNEDLVVLDALGITHFVQSGICDIMQDFIFDEISDTFPEGRAMDIEVANDSAGVWVLTDYGEIYRAGSTLGGAATSDIGTGRMGALGFDIPIIRLPGTLSVASKGSSLRAVALIVIDENLNSQADGYVILDSMGGRHQYEADGTAVVSGSRSGVPVNDPEHLLDPASYDWPFFAGLDIARDMELYPSQEGVVILDGWNGVHPVPVNDPSNAVWFARNEDPMGGPAQMVGLPYIVKGWDDPTTEQVDEGDSSEFGIDAESIFTDLEFSVGCTRGLYTLNKFGGVFALGDSRPVETEPVPGYGNSPYFFPFLYAEDMEIFGANESA